MKTTKRIFLLVFNVLLFANAQINAQVTIGGEIAPVKGATLDLSPSGGYVGSLKLPNVSLDDDLTNMPTAFTDGSAISNTDLIGSMVYNTNTNVGAGVYLWDGNKWQAMFSSGSGSLLNSIYPVGSIYISTSSTNPGSIFGGTWIAWGAGRVPVGIDTSDTDFATVEKTSGSKTSAHAHYQTFGSDGASFYSRFYGDAGVATRVIAGAAYYRAVTDAYVASNIMRENATYNTTISLLQPYITCYMWKRTQ